MAALRVLLISDGRPGHYHLSEGIVAAAARLRAVTLERLEVSRPRWMPGRALAVLLDAGLPPAQILRRVYGIQARSLPACDLVVSAGGDTLAANICAARLLGVPNIFYGSLRRFRPQSFALVLTSYARNATLPNSAMTLKPSRLDPDTLGPAPAPPPGSPPAVIGLLIGGDSGGFMFSADDWDRIVGLVQAMHRRHGTRWVISNSRRTDAGASDRIAALAAVPDGPVLEFIDVRKAGSGTLASLLARSGALAVTADSSSMLSEAVWTRRPVVALGPASARFTADEQSYRDYIQREGWASTLPLALATPDNLADALAAVRPLAINPLDHLAALLRDRLPEILAAAVSDPPV